jgi:hypothetical protein
VRESIRSGLPRHPCNKPHQSTVSVIDVRGGMLRFWYNDDLLHK